ncbi:10068_t:CDS:2 [Diversispora eburnea]|uniref:10068_t:CDS:1 n=1 Tax=Diversispora eburnea TaxID=1213867 RepID=A0A9N8Z9H0_9GLOM|nr:10068_t:CDS:2 [Diversispora eburnea]
MRSSFGTLISLLLIPLTLISWYRAYNLYNEANSNLYESDFIKPLQDDLKFYGSKSKNGNNLNIPKFNNLTIDDKLDNISDLHISKFHKTGGTSHFLHFLATILPVVSPSFVLVTGDLTDGKDVDGITSQQLIEEWTSYQTALKESGVLDRPNYWFDLRGNHDCFNVLSWESEQNLFKKFSAVKQQGFDFIIEKEFGNYRFLGIDACPKIGPARPFNFFGYYETEDMDPTTLFGETSKGETFDDIAKHISVYMCGHLHKLAWGLGDHLQTYQPSHYLELEIGDMKLNAIYRIIAIDHDLISFVDLMLPLPKIPLTSLPLPAEGNSILPDKLNFSPTILITNPKDSRFLMKYHEPVDRIKESTHIRMLIFADHEVNSVEIFFNQIKHQEDVVYKGNSKNDENNEYIPLWVSKWNPEKFDDGKEHKITVKVSDILGNVGESELIFRVDGKRSDMGGGISNMIPSTIYEGKDGSGLFWLYGIQYLSNSKWYPIFDTWRYAVEEQMLFSVDLVLLWLMIITGERKIKTSLWIVGLTYWLWRGTELIRIARIFGSVAVWFNVQTFWWGFWGFYYFHLIIDYYIDYH